VRYHIAYNLLLLQPGTVQWDKRLLHYTEQSFVACNGPPQSDTSERGDCQQAEREAREPSAGGVTLHFEDGQTQQVDAVVGADGIHSRVNVSVINRKSARAQEHKRARAPERKSTTQRDTMQHNATQRITTRCNATLYKRNTM
jgi:hypothetical protein